MSDTTSNTSGAQVVTFEYAKFSGSDKIPDVVLAELVRRLIGSVDTSELGNNAFQPLPPDDKTKVWWETDPITGIPVGNAKVWDEATESWVDSATKTAPYSAPMQRIVEVDCIVGDNTKTVTFDDMGRDDYFVSLEVNTKVAGVSIAVVDNKDMGISISGKQATQLTLNVFNVPTGGMHIRVWVRNPEVG